MAMTQTEPTPLRTPELDEDAALETIGRLERHVGRVVRGKPDVIRLVAVNLLAGGHILIEDVPGVGKTTLAQAFARSLGMSFQRVQFTSDLLPSDILGVSIYNQKTQDFEFRAGPIFANFVLADEVNRATPKTQSALLEAMSEGQVSIERRRYSLPRPFLVIATQNPLEHQGTFPLPESQLDRFMMTLRIGYPPADDERELLLSGGIDTILAELGPVVSDQELLALQAAATRITIGEKLADYMLSLAEVTREKGGEFAMGVSTRGVQNLYRASQALALCEGRGFVVPDDVQRLAVPVLAHRILLRHGSGGVDAARAAIERLVGSVPVPL